MPESEQEIGIGEIHFPVDDWHELDYFFYSPRFLDPFRLTKMRAKLRIYLDGSRRVLKRNLCQEDLKDGLEGMCELVHRSTYVGTLEIRDGRFYLGDAELEMDDLRLWIDACSRGFWGDPGITPELAAELAGMIAAHKREAERRSLETLRQTLGNEMADRLLEERKISVKSKNGMEYMITDSGEVLRRLPDGGLERVCVQVEGEHNLPKYDSVLAKYLVIRDKPEEVFDDFEGPGEEFGCVSCGRLIPVGEAYYALEFRREREVEEGEVEVIGALDPQVFCEECYRLNRRTIVHFFYRLNTG